VFHHDGNGVMEHWSAGVVGISHNTEVRTQDRESVPLKSTRNGSIVKSSKP
jgi:hypothetical protein